MTWEVGLDDVEAIAIGAGVLGTGGGGNTYLGRIKLEQELRRHGVPCRIIEATVEHLQSKYGPDARICVIPEGPQTIPYIQP